MKFDSGSRHTIAIVCILSAAFMVLACQNGRIVEEVHSSWDTIVFPNNGGQFWFEYNGIDGSLIAIYSDCNGDGSIEGRTDIIGRKVFRMVKDSDGDGTFDSVITSGCTLQQIAEPCPRRSEMDQHVKREPNRRADAPQKGE